VIWLFWLIVGVAVGAVGLYLIAGFIFGFSAWRNS